MSHNVSVEQSDTTPSDRLMNGPTAAGAPARSAVSGETRNGDRESVAAVLDELSGWGPRDRHGAFRRWHRGALSLVHLNVLAALEADGSLSMSRLAEGLDVSVASATGIVDRMERRGLVERHHGLEDRRVVFVRPTASGAGVFRDLGARRREHLGRLLSHLSDEDLAAFLRGIRALRAARERVAAEEEADGTDGTEAGTQATDPDTQATDPDTQAAPGGSADA